MDNRENAKPTRLIDRLQPAAIAARILSAAPDEARDAARIPILRLLARETAIPEYRPNLKNLNNRSPR